MVSRGTWKTLTDLRVVLLSGGADGNALITIPFLTGGAFSTEALDYEEDDNS